MQSNSYIWSKELNCCTFISFQFSKHKTAGLIWKMPARSFLETPLFEDAAEGDTGDLAPLQHLSGLARSQYIGEDGEVVISGISCRLPQSDNMTEFKENLLEGVDMVTEDDSRWPPGILLNIYISTLYKIEITLSPGQTVQIQLSRLDSLHYFLQRRDHCRS
jgi:hypothetical protein